MTTITCPNCGSQEYKSKRTTIYCKLCLTFIKTIEKEDYSNGVSSPPKEVVKEKLTERMVWANGEPIGFIQVGQHTPDTIEIAGVTYKKEVRK